MNCKCIIWSFLQFEIYKLNLQGFKNLEGLIGYYILMKIRVLCNLKIIR
ncbi:hypothetical protein SAMN05421841_0083 [Chryseobacterium wanjuense]|uniref:Uncharacterized protein n=1 Tax=Chryseobacterium wanjuense TaxID=356305 RepID=A0A1I0MP73_9FLAO|nr:hypothetical protein SAMN05421841_0083 [Chryseobacterium wanjuense]